MRRRIARSKSSRRNTTPSIPKHSSSMRLLQILLLAATATTSLSAHIEYNSFNNNNNNDANPASKNTAFPPSTGPIDDATCNVEQLEEANDRQLYVILKELTRNTTFFKNFAVDLSHKCPLVATSNTIDLPVESKKAKEVVEKKAVPSLPAVKTTTSFTSSTSSFARDPFQPPPDDNEEGSCTGELPDAEPEAKPACSIEMDDDHDTASNSFLQSSFTSPGGGMSSPSTTITTTTMEEEKKEEHVQKDKTEEEEQECDGGSVKDEMEEDAPPLCELTEEEMLDLQYNPNEHEEATLTPLKDLFSSALNTINKKLGWDSQLEKDTFTWVRPSDPVITEDEDDTDYPCDDQTDMEVVGGPLPETFWLDMCSSITEGDGLKVVNLALNPERNTGYNGTHIWRAIYDENCIGLDGSTDQPMCYEERILYRLLSGLHASTTLSIAKNYYPPNKRKGRDSWTPNPNYFYEKFSEHPEYIRNLHFSYVVLLRALKKSHNFLYNYEIRTGNIVDDETATILLRRLLDTSILQSCNGVFSAFDESLMFQQQSIFDSPEKLVSLQQGFKGVFHNISSILDCVQCQQCKLHGKMAMLGYGTALKILFLPNEDLIASSVNRNEIVAFINTIAKMSEAMLEVRELTSLYWSSQFEKKKEALPSPLPESVGGGIGDSLDAAVGVAATLAKEGMITEEMEVELVKLALNRDPDLTVLVKYYSSDLEKFLLHVQNLPHLTVSQAIEVTSQEPDAIVVGTGLAGLAATLNILDRGGRVILVEKEHLLGGNSNKASSGVNACCPNNDTATGDVESFRADTLKSAGEAVQPALVNVLVESSESAVTWLKERVGVDLSLVAQLGGHQHKRTHRPKNGMVGAEVIYGMQKAVKKYQKSGMVEIMIDTKVKSLIQDDNGRVTGVETESMLDEKKSTKLMAPNVILATGGFAADRTHESYLAKYRPELLKMPATAGNFSTGDGITLATGIGADLVDMDKVQIHPTGWVNPEDPNNPNKVLAAELMRGVGGILINKDGQRFCNELGTRAYVTDMMLSHDPLYAETRKWDQANEIPTFSLILSSSAAEDGKKHVDHYTHKGLLKKIVGLTALAEWMSVDADTVRATMVKYQDDAKVGQDQWNKPSFRGVPQSNLDEEVFYAGTVTPVLHYCMGGITIDTEGSVINVDGKIIPGLHAAGEVTGGVHGNNRLGGNSLLECTVFGTIVGKKVPIQKTIKTPAKLPGRPAPISDKSPPKGQRKVSQDELSKHNTKDDCWVAIHGQVYDLTDFADEHPAGAESIVNLAGQDGTEAFEAIHNKNLMDDFDEDLIGVYDI